MLDVTSQLIGKWKDGALVEGQWVWRNGTTFEGNFKMNKPHGTGRWIFPNGTRVQGTYSQRVLPVDEAPDDDPQPAQRIQLHWITSGVSAA